ncbi:MAG TPA: hypothetical protein VFO72_10010 [Pyrinomonadaceae bacterium]|nr:hypothetical protein [Pyrinomonadaceae bacterium]
MLVLLAILIFVYHFASGFYLLMGVEPSPAVEFLYIGASACASVWWLKSETRHSAAKSVYCKGLLVGAYWPLVLPYHLLKTRGWKGLLPLLLLIASYLFSQVLVFALYFATME